MIATTGDCDRIRLAVAPHSPYTCSPESLQRGKELARRHGLWFLTHISETEDEVRIVRERYGTTSVRHLDTLGILDDRTIGACVAMTRSCGKRGVAVRNAGGIIRRYRPDRPDA